ncbi:MAG: hypothetical protein WBW94_15210 [Anaerolineales bacterium]
MSFGATSRKASAPVKPCAIFICLFLVACAPAVAATDTPPPPTCVSPATGAINPYISSSDSYASFIYQQYKNKVINLDLAKQEAFSQLANQTKRWSDYRDLGLNETQMARITITYVSPELIEYIVLNDILFDKDNPENLDDELKNQLNDLGSRNELLFFITITGPKYNDQAYNDDLLTISIPFKQMRLINGSDLMVVPTHDDHVLNEPIQITQGPISGIIGYPISVAQGGSCVWIMDPKWNTTITLDVSSITLNQTQIDTQSWSIPYASLVGQSVQNNPPAFVATPGFDVSRVSPLTAPPTPIWDSGAGAQDASWQTYWEDMGRYIWSRIMLDDNP